MTESYIVSKILKLLRAHGAKVIKHHGSAFASAGEPDIIACIRGKTYCLEIKKPGEKPTPLQLQRLKEWENAGATACWTDSHKVVMACLDSGQWNIGEDFLLYPPDYC